jgi:uncharacterized membrane protein
MDALGEEHKKFGIEEVSGWILRLGVAGSGLVMIFGVVLSMAHHHAEVERLRSATFDANPGNILRGVIGLQGQYVIELGIYLLVATPIARVAASALLFLFSKRDYFYAAVTTAVLLMTLAGLLIFK